MRTFRKLLDLLQSITEYLLFAMIAVMVVVVFAQVFCRFVLRASLPWSEELSRYVMVWISMLGASIGIRRKGHVGVEAIVMMLPGGLRKLASMVTTLIACCFFTGMIIFGVRICGIVAAQESPAMEISMAIPYGALVAGGLLMLLYSVEELVNTRKTAPAGMEGAEKR